MPLSPGTRLGPYEIIAAVGAGGMGEVYRATDTRLGRTVAIKTLQDEHMQRFEREARAIAALNHPHICALYDVGTNYLVLEFVEGTPLKGPLPANEALRLAQQIAGALAAAHSKGIVHRDLKPANILVSESGVKLLDFGLASADHSSDSSDGDTRSLDLTQRGVLLGTAAYMSPEQAEAKPVDPRSDIFSFGLVLYELLSGTKAFAADSAVASIAAILYKEPQPLEAPAALKSIVARCLRKNRTERFQSIAELQAALDRAAANPTEVQHERPASIAVLPFANMSGNADDEYFSDGLAEEIINALTQVTGLKVIARTSAFAFKGKNEDIRKIAETLGVSSVLEGSVRRSGNRIRVMAQLIHASDGSHQWSQRYDREMTDVFAIQDEISAAIVCELKGTLTGRDFPRCSVTNVAAYEAVLEARHHLNKVTPMTLDQARQRLEHAIALDPNYAPAHAAMAEYFMALSVVGTQDSRQVLPQAEAAARRALELDPDMAEAYSVLGQVNAELDYDWAASNENYAKSLALNPASAGAHFSYAYWCLRPTGRLNEALTEIERALEMDPLSPFYRFGRAYLLLFLGREEEAAEAAERTYNLDPDFFLSLFLLGYVRARQHRFQEASMLAERAVQIHGRWTMSLLLAGMVHVEAGRREAAMGVLKELEEHATETRPTAGGVAIMHSLLGNADEAIAWAEAAIEKRDPQILSLKTSPVFEFLRGDSRYPALLTKMNL